jgi:hypothetical protein
VEGVCVWAWERTITLNTASSSRTRIFMSQINPVVNHAPWGGSAHESYQCIKIVTEKLFEPGKRTSYWPLAFSRMRIVMQNSHSQCLAVVAACMALHVLVAADAVKKPEAPVATAGLTANELFEQARMFFNQQNYRARWRPIFASKRIQRIPGCREGALQCAVSHCDMPREISIQ